MEFKFYNKYFNLKQISKFLVFVFLIIIFILVKNYSNILDKKNTVVIDNNKVIENVFISSKDFIGPRGNILANTPTENGFNMFSIVNSGVLSRSGQPTINEFKWLKNNGWKSVIDLRISGDRNESANDEDIAGFSNLGFNYLWIQILDGSTPTEDQVKQFLDFVKNPNNQPVEIHCFAGVGRTGVMVAIYRYKIQGWPMDKAISESKLYNGGINEIQEEWLKNWAVNNKI